MKTNTKYFVANINMFNKENTAVNGVQPLILDVIAGSCPKRRIISPNDHFFKAVQDYFEAKDIVIGDNTFFAMMFQEARLPETHPKHPNLLVYRWKILSKIDGLDVLDHIEKLGEAHLFDDEITLKKKDDSAKDEE